MHKIHLSDYDENIYGRQRQVEKQGSSIYALRNKICENGKKKRKKTYQNIYEIEGVEMERSVM